MFAVALNVCGTFVVSRPCFVVMLFIVEQSSC